MPLTRVILLFALLAAASPRDLAAQTVDPLRLPEPEARRWASRQFNPAPKTAANDPWLHLERGSFEAFSETAAEYVKVFPSAQRSFAAVVSYRRDPAPTQGLAVVARLEVVDRSGATLRAFDVEPHLQFDVSNDGMIVVGHGETMVGAITCGILSNSLAIYSGDGAAPRRVRSPEFSPAHSLVLLDASRVIVMAVSGRILAFDPDSGNELWRRPFAHRNDTADLVTHPNGDVLAATIRTHAGDARVELLDGAGAERGRFPLSGRPGPGAAVRFRDNGYLTVGDIVNDEIRLHLLDARTLAHLRTLSGL